MFTPARGPENQQYKIAEALSLLDKAILEMIMAGRPLAKVLETLCLMIEQKSPGLICSVLLLEQSNGTLHGGVGPSLPKSYLDAVNGSKIGPRAGSCGSAAYLQKPIVASDITNDPLWSDYKHLAIRHGLRACWSVPILSQDGNTLGTLACYYHQPRTPEHRDLTLIERASHLAGIAIEHHRTKVELNTAEKRYRSLIERLPAITYMAEVGVEGQWHFVSPQIEAMLGFTVEEWLADRSRWISCIHEEDREIALAAEDRIQRTGELYQAEYRMRARDGRILWFRDEAKLIETSAEGTPIMQGLLYDITGYKRLEDQLRQAQKMEAVGQLAGGIAHDFNNLLMVIQAHVDRIRAELEERNASYADAGEIQNAVLRASSLTSQLLAFSRKQILQPKVLRLGPVLNEVGTMLGRIIGTNITLQIESEPGLAKVKVDRGQLEQAIFNLAVNARDAMRDGGVLKIKAQNVDFREPKLGQHSSLPPGPYVMLEVSDTGSGIAPELQSRIFEPFFTTKAPGKGTGLGLSQVYGVVKQSDGAISVHSEPNVGTTFKVLFPACDEEVVPGPREHTPSRKLSGNETILLVEDELAIREVISSFLMTLGYDVLTAEDGEAALRIVTTQQQGINLLITDLMMPNMGGRELAARINELSPQTRVLCMSGYADDGINTDENLNEDIEILQKPFSLQRLAAKARSILDNNGNTPSNR